MIRTSSFADLRALDNVQQFLERYPQHVKTVIDAAWKSPVGEAELIGELKAYPAARSGAWGGWSPNPKKNAKAARWWFAAIRDGRVNTDGRHYIRSGKLANGYRADLLQTGKGELLVSVGNTEDRAYRWTKGKRQIPGHRRTGWKQDDAIISRWQNRFRSYVIKELDAATFAIISVKPR